MASNVLLVVLDSVRARNLDLYGYHRTTAPFLTEYADSATVYTQARAPGIHSVASHASMWTGREVEEHRAIHHEDQIPPDSTVWATLADAGYHTGMFTTNAVVAHASNLSEPFETLVTDDPSSTDSPPFPTAHAPADTLRHEGVLGNLRRSIQDDQPIRSLVNCGHHFLAKQWADRTDSPSTSDLVEAFLNWESGVDGPWGAFINLMDAHFPYLPEAEHDLWGGEALQALHVDKPPSAAFLHDSPWWQLEVLEHLYDGAIHQVDAAVQRIVEGLRRSGALEDTLVVVTADHGEGFGEVSEVSPSVRLIDHSWGIDEELTHVPLVVKYPGQSERQDVDEPATLRRFPRTVESLLNGDPGRASFVPDGPVLSSTYRLLESQRGLFEGSEEDPDDYMGPWRAVYEETGGEVHKYAVHGDDDAIQVVRSAQERHAVNGDARSQVEQQFGALEPWDVERPERRELSELIEQRLADLGYVR